MFNKLLSRFKWYRRHQYIKLTKRMLNGDWIFLLANFKCWLDLYKEFGITEEFYGIRFDSKYERAVDFIKDVNLLAKDINVGHSATISSTNKIGILLDDWFVDKDCYRYDFEAFCKGVCLAIDSIGEGFNELDYSSISYYDGKYQSLFVTLRELVAAISRQLKV